MRSSRPSLIATESHKYEVTESNMMVLNVGDKIKTK